jgi:predicted RNA-binding protein associated with RNAse of E/G family
MVGRAMAHWMQTWLLPGLGLAVTDWWWNPGHARDQDFYLDVCEIHRDGGRWVMTDHYLDIIVQHRRGAQVIDVDEFTAAVALGLLAPDTAELAMHRAYRAVDGLAAHGYDLDCWLGGLGIELSWRRAG